MLCIGEFISSLGYLSPLAKGVKGFEIVLAINLPTLPKGGKTHIDGLNYLI
jgi:hypothetical protein